jgi:glucose/arabinose dehydrogenase
MVVQMRSGTRSSIRRASAVALLAATVALPPLGPSLVAAAPAPGFQENVVWSGLSNPTAIRFAADGRVFVAEKSGVIKIFDSLSDPTPTSFSGLSANVHNFWDRGLLGLALDPSLTGGVGGTGSYVYVMYAYDHILGSGTPAPRWGDTCPTPPGPTTDGCVISGRLSRFAVSGSTITGSEQVLIEDWCQQFPSHSAGTLLFGPDGALYASGGDGASFNVVDYGQRGGTTTPIITGKNPCGDPPNDAMTPPTAEGGSLRSQDVRSSPIGGAYRGTVLADTPISYWRLGETSGTSALDEVGANPGTYVGGPTLGVGGALSGDANTSVALNGTSQYVSVPSSTPFRFAGTAPFSAEIWFRHTADGTYRRVIGAENANGQGWHLYSQNQTWGFVRSGTGGAAEVGDGSPAGAGWVHAVATYDGATMRLYENGVEIPLPVGSSQSLPADTSFYVGRYGGAPVSMFNGTIDEPAIYGYALTPGEVATHYAAAAALLGDPVGLDGTVLRLDPATGAGMPGNPFAASSDANARRIIAYGLRNPFRITFRPGTNELWLGDVGWETWEEIDRIPDATDGVAENFGWPCYEGVGRQSGYDAANLSLCETLYSQGTGAVASPIFTYNHGAKVVATDSCPTGSSSVTGMAFYPEAGGSFPAAYRGGLFFADHSRNCVWFMPKGSNGQPDPTAISPFIEAAAHPVDLVVGPAGDLFYVDFEGGTIRRVSPTGGNQPPTAVIQAVPTGGPAPLDVQFDGSGSSDPEGTPLTYDWDLDGDGAYDDATGVTASRTYASPGNVTVGLRVTDAGTATGTDTQLIAVSNSPPVPVISTPTAGTTWRVGDLISFSGSATDPQDGQLPASALTWSLVIQHCPSNCHTHTLQSWPGVASGSFNAPDHEYPSYLELTLTATDGFGTQASVTRRLDPQTVDLTFQSVPSGLSLAVNASSSTTSFTRTLIIGSANTVSASSPQSLNGFTYAFSSWSDGGAQTHTIVAPATAATYTATYESTGFSVLPVADAHVRSQQGNKNFGTASDLRVRVNQYRTYVKFVVTGLSGQPTSAKLRLWVTDGGTNGGSAYAIANTTWTETGITWNNAPAIIGSPLSTVGTATLGTWVEFDVRPAISGNGTYTFAISNGNNDAVDYASRETANDPVLILTP